MFVGRSSRLPWQRSKAHIHGLICCHGNPLTALLLREIGVVSACCGSGICCSGYLDGVLVVGLVVSLTTVYLTCLYDFMFFTGCFVDIFLVLSEIEQVCTGATLIVTQ